MSTIGYHNAPVSKVCLLTVLSANVFGTIVGIPVGPSKIGYLTPMKMLFSPMEWWRLLFGPFVFSTIGEVFFGLLLLHTMRVFERRWGSTKFAVFVLLTSLFTFFMQFTVCFVTDSMVWNGPYGYLFAMLVQYILDVPATLNMRIWKIPLTEKYFVYLLASQLFFSNVPGSTVAAICGMICGLFYRFRFMKRIHKYVPKFIIKLCSKYLHPLVNPRPFRIRPPRNTTTTRNIPFSSNQAEEPSENNPSEPQIRNLANEGGNSQQQLQDLLRSYQRTLQRSQQPSEYNPTEDEVQQMVEMGFDAEQSRQALIRTNGNVSTAVSQLL